MSTPRAHSSQPSTYNPIQRSKTKSKLTYHHHHHHHHHHLHFFTSSVSHSLSLSLNFFKSMMILNASSSSSLLPSTNGDTHFKPMSSSSSSTSFSSCSVLHFSQREPLFKVSASSKDVIIFDPFEEVKKELSMVPTVPQQSLARQKYYSSGSESAINEQINVEYNVMYVYHAMFAYFDRDNVAHKGLAKFFKDSSEEERHHAEKLMEYQNKRGGKVKLQSIVMPLSEFDHSEKGDALYAMELALSLEKLTNEKLLNLHKVGEKQKDVHLMDFVESEFLTEQVEAIKKISEYVSQLRRIGKGGHGVWHFNQMLLQAQ